MRKEFLLLEKIIKEKTKNSKIYYLHNPGNYGDSLIRYGTMKFFDDIGLNFKELKTFNLLKPEWWGTLVNPNSTLIFAGSGAWCKFYNREDFIKKISKRFKQVIILPSTFEIAPNISNAIFFSRDKYESMENMPSSFFCHDMAFYIETIESEKGNGIGYFFRKDIESLNKVNIPPQNTDISLKGNHLSPIFDFINEISKFKIIYTDRLHVAIGASLLKKEVHLFPNSYFKNKAIYLSSLKPFYENVYFHENFDL